MADSFKTPETIRPPPFYPIIEEIRRERYVPPRDTEEEDETYGGAMLNLLLRLGCVSTPLHLVDGCEDFDDPLNPPHPLDGVQVTYNEAVDVDFHRKQQILLCEQSELLFLDELKKMFTNGFRLVLHTQGIYQAHTAHLENEDLLSWKPAARARNYDDSDEENDNEDLIFIAKNLDPERFLHLKDIIDIQAGNSGLSREVEDRCFVLITFHSRLIFETVDSETRQLLYEGFHILLKHYHKQLEEEDHAIGTTGTPSSQPSSSYKTRRKDTERFKQHEELDYDECRYDDIIEDDNDNNSSISYSSSPRMSPITSPDILDEVASLY